MWIFLLQALVFLSSFLIFQIELVLGKIILPGFGGGYLVWGISVVLYQGLLLLGYLYVHLLNRFFLFKRYRIWQTTAVLLSLLCFPLQAGRLQNPLYHWSPVVEIVVLLSLTIGIPFFILAGLSVYAQIHAIHSTLPEKKNPYILFAASNFGAFTALLTYPFFVEPQIGTETQLRAWEAGYAVMAFLFVILQWRVPLAPEQGVHRNEFSPCGGRKILTWLALSAATSALFLSITNELTFNIAPVPLLWVLPLALYLLSFVLAFKRNPFCPRWLEVRFGAVVSLGVVLFFIHATGNTVLEFLVPVMVQFRLPWYAAGVLFEPLLLLAICFILCLVCHCRLQEEKPAESGQLTTFYLTLAIGGFLGGVLVNWVIPLIFNTTLELLLSYLLAVLGFVLVARKGFFPKGYFAVYAGGVVLLVILWPVAVRWLGLSSKGIVGLCAVAGLYALLYRLRERPVRLFWAVAALAVAIPFLGSVKGEETTLFKKRDYYGIYQVFERNGFRYLRHGTVIHGAQHLNPAPKPLALTYYHAGSPMGEFLGQNPLGLHRIALIGLGTGTLATYAGPSDEYDYFELDPLVGKIARKYFSFISNSRGRVNIIYGDARVSLRKQPPGRYDAMIVDVFNSGSIPVHLLTVEAVREYFRLLKPGGILFFHLSNEYLDLKPVVLANARALNLYPLVNESRVQDPPEKEYTLWAGLTADAEADFVPRSKLGWKRLEAPPTRPWTDRYSSIFAALSN